MNEELVERKMEADLCVIEFLPICKFKMKMRIMLKAGLEAGQVPPKRKIRMKIKAVVEEEMQVCLYMVVLLPN